MRKFALNRQLKFKETKDVDERVSGCVVSALVRNLQPRPESPLCTIFLLPIGFSSAHLPSFFQLQVSTEFGELRSLQKIRPLPGLSVASRVFLTLPGWEPSFHALPACLFLAQSWTSSFLFLCVPQQLAAFTVGWQQHVQTVLWCHFLC